MGPVQTNQSIQVQNCPLLPSKFNVPLMLPTDEIRGEYFTKFPDNYRGKVSPEDQVLGKSLLI